VFALNPSDGGLGIPILKKEAPWQHGSSIFITKPHAEAIGRQSQTMTAVSAEEDTQETLKKRRKKASDERKGQEIERINETLDSSIKHIIDQARDKGASSWLNTLPIEEMGFTLNKEEFRDALRL